MPNVSVANLYKSCSVGFCAHGVTCLSMIFCLDSLYTAQNENFSMVGLGSFCQNKQDDIFFRQLMGLEVYKTPNVMDHLLQAVVSEVQHERHICLLIT